jgi:hypothetical protein
MKETTILEVVRRGNRKFWVIKRCDSDSTLIGQVTASGTPARAQDLPEGSTFECTLRLPRKAKNKPEPDPTLFLSHEMRS